MHYSTKVKVADIIFSITSRFPRVFKSDKDFYLRKYGNFFGNHQGRADIKLEVHVVEKFPVLKGREIFAVYEGQETEERWRLFDYGNRYIYYTPMADREALAYISRDFTHADVYVLPHQEQMVWDMRDVIYDCMQVILINYFALNKNGLILHAAAIKDGNKGLVFAGRSGSGKSTSARLWHKYTKAAVLNDDRVIVRRIGRQFYVYSGPWHGEFGNGVVAYPRKAPLKGLFFIEHAEKNFVCKLDHAQAFRELYPSVFSVFWNRRLMLNVVVVCETLLSAIAARRLGFVKNKSVIAFVRTLSDETNQL